MNFLTQRGISLAGGSSADLAKLAEHIFNRQRDDGGWAQRDELASDAYATGMTLSILAESGVLRPASAAYAGGALG